jgi:NADH-quinone oxidoreductase subunit C
MHSLETLKAELETALPGASLEVLANPAVPAQGSLQVAPAFALPVARLLRDRPDLAFDLCSNVTGVDWPERIEKLKVKRVIDGVEKEIEESCTIPGYLEVVYHLYSVARKDGPVVIRQRTANRTNDCSVASLTSIWRSCEFQEREVFDLFGVNFEGHPDLRRILMWDGFVDHPMRKDYVEPDDYEHEPTPHGDVLEKAQLHYPKK